MYADYKAKQLRAEGYYIPCNTACEFAQEAICRCSCENVNHQRGLRKKPVAQEATESAPAAVAATATGLRILVSPPLTVKPVADAATPTFAPMAPILEVVA